MRIQVLNDADTVAKPRHLAANDMSVMGAPNRDENFRSVRPTKGTAKEIRV